MNKPLLLPVLLFPILISTGLTSALAQQSHTDAAPFLDGDIGIGVNHTAQIGRSASSTNQIFPYANFDYGNLFARVDTFGYKITPIGYGNIELVGRFIGDGYTPAASAGNLAARQTSVPIGLGTLQITPIGAFFLNAYHDVNQSGGNLADLIFAGQWKANRVTLYPEAGAEYRSRNYVRYFYGVSPGEASQFKLNSYAPNDATNLFVALFAEIKINGPWYLNGQLRRTWLDKSISDSPLVERRSSNSGFIALSYRFE